MFDDKMMCSKMLLEFVKNKSFKYFTINQEERYRSIVVEYWGNVCKFPRIGVYSS